MSKNVKKWSDKKVLKWIKSLNDPLSKYAKDFEANMIDGQQLIDLIGIDNADLKEIISVKKDRKLFKKEVKKLLGDGNKKKKKRKIENDDEKDGNNGMNNGASKMNNINGVNPINNNDNIDNTIDIFGNPINNGFNNGFNDFGGMVYSDFYGYNNVYTNGHTNGYSNNNNYNNNNYNNYSNNNGYSNGLSNGYSNNNYSNANSNNNNGNYNSNGLTQSKTKNFFNNVSFFGFGGNKNNNNNNNNNNSNNNSNNSDLNKKMFKDVNEIMRNDEQDLAKDYETITKIYTMYDYVYTCKPNKYNSKDIKPIIKVMMGYIPESHKKNYDQNNNENDSDIDTCMVCYMNFEEKNDDYKRVSMQQYCQHSMICASCFKQYLSIKIRDKDVTPWILCAKQNCNAPIHYNILFKYLETKQLYAFAIEFLYKHLNRYSQFIPCINSKSCRYGFILDNNNKGKTINCSNCGTKQKIEKKSIKNDKGFNELIQNGALRMCPACDFPTMKDKGMCNIIHCGKCSVWWNWRTKEVGTNSKELKSKARNNGTLWEPGELAYQQKLQRDNPQEFIKLLERNGIKYNKNYKRGT